MESSNMPAPSKPKVLNLIRRIGMTPSFEKALVRLTTGRIYGSLLTKIAPNHYQYPSGTIRHVERDGIRYELDLSDIVDWFIYFGFQEIPRLKLYGLLKTGQVFIDIGANVGDVTMHASNLVGEKGSVIALEPDPLNFSRLIKNLSLNAFSNINPLNIGAGDKEGKFSIFSVKSGNAGMNRILNGHQSGEIGREVSVTTLDKIAEELSLDRIDLVKIDTEGYEYKVLTGSKECIRRFKPTFFIELDDANLRTQGSSASGLIHFLNQDGYLCRRAGDGNLLSEKQEFKNCHFDLIAVHKSKLDQR